jgi:hypothetical protein
MSPKDAAGLTLRAQHTSYTILVFVAENVCAILVDVRAGSIDLNEESGTP